MFYISATQKNIDSAPNVVTYSYDEEVVHPYLYHVLLDEENIELRIAPSHQSAIYEITFLQPGRKVVLLQTRSGTVQDTSEGYSLRELSSVEFSLFAETNPAPVEHSADATGHRLYFDSSVSKVVVRWGLSVISVDQAKANLRREITTWNLDEVAEAGKKAWNDAVGQITVSGGTEDEKCVFYTSIYRT
jgi:putative alpha-1,2-mannosidase